MTQTEIGFADLLLPYAMVDDGVLLQRDGSLVAGWSYHGPDLMSAVEEELAAQSHRLNDALILGSGWMVQCDAIRSQAPGYPTSGAFPDVVTRVIDDERARQFARADAHYETQYYLTLTYLPPLEIEEKAIGWLFEGGVRPSTASIAADRFKARVELFENVFANLFRANRLGKHTVTDDLGRTATVDTLLQYYRRTITGDDYPFVLPQHPDHLYDILSCNDFTGGIEPRIGDKRIGVVAIDGFPENSYPGILRDLDSLRCEYRWHSRAILIDTAPARKKLEKISKKWSGKKRGIVGSLFPETGGSIDGDAVSQAADADEAKTLASGGSVRFCHYTTSVVCLDEDANRLHNAMREVMRSVQNSGFSCRKETVNAIEAWRGTLPGDGYRNVRRVILHTMNLADMLPVTSVWSGLRENPSPLMPKHSPPHILAATGGGTPYRYHSHVGDLGHALVVGPPGAGKSTFLGLCCAQWFRYPKAQVFVFDKGYSMWALTVGAGGAFYDLAGPDSEFGFCPLRDIDSDADLTWASTWTEVLCALGNMELTPRQRNELTRGLIQTRLSPERTLTEFHANVQDEEIRQAIEYYTLNGALGAIFDRPTDMLRDLRRLTTFETEHLMSLDARAVVPTLLLLFHRIEQRLDGSPTLIVLDEAWAYLAHGLFREKLREWLKTMRKKNVVVILATQQISDLSESTVADVVFESCPTKILLPNPEAKTPVSSGFYRRVGLNEREIDMLSAATPKKHYYITSALGRRMVDFDIGFVARAFIGVNGREERESLQQLIAAHPDGWKSKWLESKKLPEWANYMEALCRE